LIHGPIRTSFAVFDTNTLLVSSLNIVLGFQVIIFGIFARVFAESEGLLPPNPGGRNFFDFFTLEKGLALGLLLFFLGIAVLIKAFLFWRAAGFGAISYPESLRQVIPAVTLITLGVQIIFSSFFLSILNLPRK
jgi:hypothetical protein